MFRYKGRDLDPQAAGRELNVRVVLTGRVIQRGETLVVGTELLDVQAGSQLWGERYNRKIADIFALEEEIARKISESLRMKLTGKRRAAWPSALPKTRKPISSISEGATTGPSELRTR